VITRWDDGPVTTGRQSPVRWALLLAVIAGIFAMHVLTPGDGPGHGSLPTAAGTHHGMTADPMAEPVMAPEAFVTAWVGAEPPSSEHGDMAGCILFLVVGGVLLLLAALARRNATVTAPGPVSARRALFDMRRRGPPRGRPRLALGVIRV
jgi:hypothetical protein